VQINPTALFSLSVNYVVQLLSGFSTQRRATDVTDAITAITDVTTDEASDRSFDISSFMIKIKLLGVF